MERTMFGTRLTSLRKARRMTQEQVATRLEVNRTTYTCYEIGNSLPGVMTLCKIADIFDVSLDYLMGRIQTEKPDDAMQVYPSAEELQLTESYRMLNDRQRRALRELIKCM